jgi:hypothetical protein
MRIKQLFSAFGNHFAEAIAKKYDLELNNESLKMDEPLFMFGCYGGKQIWRAITHSAGGQMTVICWAGSDANNPGGFPGVFNQFPNIKHIAISKWIAADLGMNALSFYRIPVTPYDHSDIKPEPLGDSIYMYKPDSRVYNGGIYQQVKEALPEYNFIESSWGDHTRKEMLDIYKKCFIGLRFTEHDGLSNTVCEMGMMGRYMVNNGELPNCLHYDSNNISEIVNMIKRASITMGSMALAKGMSHNVAIYLNIGDSFLNTEYYESL